MSDEEEIVKETVPVLSGCWNAARSKPEEYEQTFLKGVKWSPDGSCILSASDDKYYRLYDFNNSLLKNDDHETSFISPSLRIFEGESIYDYDWYPYMRSSEPISCCFLTTSCCHPIHLFDAYSGKIRASYKACNSVDEPISAVSASFHPSGTRFFCGYNRCIRIFDTAVSNADPFVFPTFRKKTRDGVFGIISCFSFRVDSDIFAAGSYSSDIALLDSRTSEVGLILEGHKNGVTQVRFSWDGNFLFSGARKDNVVYCWDIRNTKSAYDMFRCERYVHTNQRIQFDVDRTGRYLISGGTNGYMYCFDLANAGAMTDSVKLNTDCINGVSFHPLYPENPIFAVSTGMRRRRQIISFSEEMSSDDEDVDIIEEAGDDDDSPDNGMYVWSMN